MHVEGTAALTAQLAEVQVFGEGYQPEVTLTSDLIRLRGSRNLFAIEWDADTPPGTEVALQTRTGARLDTAFHYFRIVGEDTLEIVKETEEEAKKAYDKLRLGKGPIVPELVAAGDWEPWSEPYTDPEGSCHHLALAAGVPARQGDPAVRRSPYSSCAQEHPSQLRQSGGPTAGRRADTRIG